MHVKTLSNFVFDTHYWILWNLNMPNFPDSELRLWDFIIFLWESFRGDNIRKRMGPVGIWAHLPWMIIFHSQNHKDAPCIQICFRMRKNSPWACTQTCSSSSLRWTDWWWRDSDEPTVWSEQCRMVISTFFMFIIELLSKWSSAWWFVKNRALHHYYIIFLLSLQKSNNEKVAKHANIPRSLY